MSPKKKSRATIQVVIANNDEPLVVDENIVRARSLVASELPESATVWDISGLLIEGEPAKRETVVKWLNLAYRASRRKPYEQPSAQQPDTTTAAELYELLAFADSIASSQNVYLPLVANNELRKLRIQIGNLPEAFEPVRPAVDGRPYVFCNCNEEPSLHLSDPGVDMCKSIRIPENSEAALTDEVVEQVEKLLYISYKLKLEPLLQRLHMFVAAAAAPAAANEQRRAIIPRDKMTVIYSPRVLEASGYNEEASRRAWIASEMQKHLTIINGPDALLTPDVDAPWDPSSYREGLFYPATLNRDWAGMQQGDNVHIQFDVIYWLQEGRVIVQKDKENEWRDFWADGMLSMRAPQF